jgi:hypothetical protein
LTIGRISVFVKKLHRTRCDIKKIVTVKNVEIIATNVQKESIMFYNNCQQGSGG